jgi:hypothetical protein
VLAPGGKPLTGLVTDATGGSVAGARVDAAGLGRIARASDAVATTMTGSDGYKLTVAMGQLLVGVSNPDYAPQATAGSRSSSTGRRPRRGRTARFASRQRRQEHPARDDAATDGGPQDHAGGWQDVRRRDHRDPVDIDRIGRRAIA